MENSNNDFNFQNMYMEDSFEVDDEFEHNSVNGPF